MNDLHDYLRSGLGQAAMLTFAGTAAVEGLIAVWAATSRAHWFLRAMAVWGGVMLLVPIRVYEPAAVFVFASPLIVAVIVAANRLASRYKPIGANGNRPLIPSNLPLSLSDLYFPTVILALVVIALELKLQGHWWFDPIDFLAWCIIIVAIVATAYDCITARGQNTRQRLISLLRLATTSLRVMTAPLAPANAGPQIRAKFRFGLSDLFGLILLVALAIVGVQAINHRYSWQEWGAFALWGALVAAIVSLAYGCAVSRWRLILAPLLVLAVAATARIAPDVCGPFFSERFIECLGLGRAFAWKGAGKLLVLEIVYAELALLVVVVSLLVALSQARVSQASVRRLTASALAALTVLAGAWLAWHYVQMLWLTPIPPNFTGGPNHYDRIAAITAHVDPRLYWGLPIPPVATAKPVIATVTGDKQQLFGELSLLVQASNYVPFAVGEDIWRLDDIRVFRRRNEHFYSIALVIDAEAVAASESGEVARAAELAVVNIRLGTMLRRGGTRPHTEAGKYCESFGYQRLTILRDKLSPDSMRSALTAICRADSEKEDIAIVMARDQAFDERALGWTMRLRYVFDKLQRREAWNPDWEINTFNVLLQTDLAIRLFQRDRGRLPKNLEELVPDYLAAVPLGPNVKSKQPLIYRVEDGRFVLYSVNSFGTDNGGHFGNRERALHFSTHDLDVETWIRP